MNRMRHILFFLPMAILLAACTQDELTEQTGEALPDPIPLQLTAMIGEAVATPSKTATRGTVDGTWDGGEVIHVQIASNKDAGFTSEAAIDWATIEPVLYTVGTNGTLTLKDPTKQVYWQATSETLYIRAWCAGTGEDYTDIPMPGNDYIWSTPKDQSTSDALKQADFLFAYRSMTFEERTVHDDLKFSHLTSKITINLVNSSYLENKDVSVSLVSVPSDNITWSIEGIFEGSGSNLALKEQSLGGVVTSITPCKLSSANGNYYASYEAIVIPQGFNYGYHGIEVTVDNTRYRWTIKLSALEVKGGMEYTFDITVKEQGLEVSAGSSIDWGEGGSGTGSVTLPIEIDLSQATGDITISDDKAYLLTGTGSCPVKISGDATVILQGVSLSTTSGNAISITDNANAILHISGENSVSSSEYAGIYVAQGSTLTITGDSRSDILSAEATGENSSCGIGGYMLNESPWTSYNCGNILITNVTVYAQGGSMTGVNLAPGIGNSGQATGGTITIDNATVHAYGVFYKDRISTPGIGNGMSVMGLSSSIPVVTIKGNSKVHTHRGGASNLSTDYIGWTGIVYNNTEAATTINCGTGGGVYSSTVYCYTGEAQFDKIVVYDESGKGI